MNNKYVVSQKFMDELKEWKEANITTTLDEKYHYVAVIDLYVLPDMIQDWRMELNKPIEMNNRLIAIIRWVNGEDVFEIEKPKKWVVRDKVKDIDGDYWYVLVEKNYGVEYTSRHISRSNNYTKFDTKEEAESWTNAHQEVVQVEVDE